MKTISVKDLRFALRAIDEIYGLTDKDIQITGNKNSFRLTFFFMQRKITVDKREDRDHTVYLVIYVTEKPHIPSVEVEPTEFWELYAYYDNAQTSAFYNNDNLYKYLKYLRRYIEENKIFSQEFDVPNERRYFYLEGVKKELPYAVRANTYFEYSQMFGKDKIEQMMRNIPIGCAPM